MKTSLHFEAPSDLSVGTVRITGDGRDIADWVATPDNRTFQQEDLKPGIYSAEIGPAGVAPQSVLFEIREGQANTVLLPTFSALSSSGSNTSFFDIETQRAVSDVPDSIKVEIAPQPLGLSPDHEQTSGLQHQTSIEPETPRPLDVSSVRRRITIALSEEARGREAFDTFRGKSKMELLSGRLEIEIPTDPARDPWAGHRVRLSAAIENVRIERCLLPLYKGGTRITIAPPAFAAADLEISIMPVDPKLRALVRALDAGTSAEAVAVRDDVLGKKKPSIVLAEGGDPWAAILVGLLAIRFPDVFHPIHPIHAVWADSLVEQVGWAFDTHVIRASRALFAASSSSREAQADAVTQAVADLANAQIAGSPYYRYTNQLFAELAGGIESYLKMNRDGVDETARRRFDRLYSRWCRELPLQRGAGSTFTWLARDQIALKERNVLAPHRNPSGRLRGRDSTVIFEGQVGAGQIAIISAGPNATQPLLRGENNALSQPIEQAEEVPRFALSHMPALQRSPGPESDPNKGRFGREASRDGFRLTSAFEEASSRTRVTITLTVEADSSAKLGLGDFAWFALHPTFSPPVLKVSFRGNRARLRIQAWGGFTVGVWIPATGVELESDLALLPDAPRIIQSR
ncbi:pYEATS domain-containing protein [Sinorhizobium meliloti]|uniref:pYEATS domain-containing protein n=1 Tax=Rhizobium meliloti TaxID=382 RepID=UPI003F18855D